jgi:hypothetical protein
MNKERDGIPLWTWYNGQFLFLFDEQLKKNPNQTISQFFTIFLTSQGLQNQSFYHTKNQGTVILLLYGLLVIPKEIWEKDYTNFSFSTRQKFILNPPTVNNLDTFNFLRLFRNSLAHANFHIDIQTTRLTFWNNQKDGTRNFEVEIYLADLAEFTAEVGKYYINVVRNRAN